MTDQTMLVPLTPDVEAELDRLARRHRAARGLGMQVLDLIGGQVENLLERLPDRVKTRLEGATTEALKVALSAAGRSRGVVPDSSAWFTRALTTAMGAAGGAGGLPTALAELPLTVTVLLRAIQTVAEEHGIDPETEEGRAECLKVFAAAGPMEADNATDFTMLAARVTLTGATVQGVLARIAPRLATALGQKLAAQTVPVLGAVAGAATNYLYTSYYQEMAAVHFGLLRLARESGVASEDLTTALRARLERRSVRTS